MMVLVYGVTVILTISFGVSWLVITDSEIDTEAKFLNILKYIFNYEITTLVIFNDLTVFASFIMQIRILYFFYHLRTQVEETVLTSKDSADNHSKLFFENASLKYD